MEFSIIPFQLKKTSAVLLVCVSLIDIEQEDILLSEGKQMEKTDE